MCGGRGEGVMSMNVSEVCLGEGRGETGVLLLFFLSRGGCGKVATNTETVF